MGSWCSDWLDGGRAQPSWREGPGTAVFGIGGLCSNGEGWDVKVSMGAGRGKQAAGENDAAGSPSCQVRWLGIPSPST
jgi:hypothetical protein